MKRVVIILLGLAVVLFGEPSVYSGQYTTDNTRSGVSSAEIVSLRQKIADMQEEIEGLKSMVESLSRRMNKMGSSSASAGSTPSLSDLEALKKRVDTLEKSISASSSAKQKTSASKKPPSIDDYLKKAPSSKLFSRGVMLVKEKKYLDAQKRFEILLSRSYKPASSNFYMGEINYGRGKYTEAIKYYQISAEKNENAAYMDRLLLHTAISLEKTGNEKQAKGFFQAIVDGYPDSASAREAKKHLH